ncbi:MAG: LacI family DNA-binding transcriptional regulator [Lacisediminihabitans sp.]
MAKRVGITDVAKAAGVSATTVSHALSDQGNLSLRTREHVQQVARDLGYAPNRIASALRLQRTSVIGLVSDEIATTPFAGRIVLGAQDAAAKRGLLLMLVNSNRDQAVEDQQIASLIAQQVDGIVYARMSHLLVDLPPRLYEIPTVIVDAENPEGRAPWVVPDEQQIGRTATKLLIDAGHRRIVHLTIKSAGPGVAGRLAGYRAAMLEHGLQPCEVRADDPANAHAGRVSFVEALERVPDLTAVFAFNDAMALGVYQVSAQRGLRIPEDLSVVGVDNLEVIAAQLLPGLTTVSLPHYEMGRWAIEQLVAMIAERPHPDRPPHVKLACPLIERGSVAPPNV